MKILLVEDDVIIWENIKDYLQENNFMVTLISDWKNWLKEALKNEYDLFIFDIMLPYLSWIEIIKELKQEKNTTPIILLTAKEDLETKEIWFSIWADDYITKPFSLKELLLRVRSLLRRTNNSLEFNTISVWNITLNQDLKQVFREDKVIVLTPKEFQILEYLMVHHKKVVRKSELLEYLWWINNDIWSDVIRTHINSLRTKLNEWFDEDPIKTVRWIWFKFWDYEN